MSAQDGVETEVKLRVTDAPEARRRLSACGATLVRARHFEDNLLFDDERGSRRGQGEVLRLRRTREDGPEGPRTLARVTWKGPGRVEGGVRSRPEIELDVGDADAFEALFGRLGYRPNFRYQKYRETWRVGAAEVVLDETPIGCFFEIEGPREAIHAAAASLGYAPRDFVLGSYVVLFAAAGGRGDMVFA